MAIAGLAGAGANRIRLLRRDGASFCHPHLDAYRVLVLSTHPEYWSRQMYDRVKQWVFERGGRLVYLAGNGLNCDVEFIDEQTCIYRNDNERRLRAAGATSESRFHLRH